MIGYGSWLGTKVRKGEKEGVVVSDKNRASRTLTVKFNDGTTGKIEMNNFGLDPESVHEYEWFCKKSGSLIDRTWVRF